MKLGLKNNIKMSLYKKDRKEKIMEKEQVPDEKNGEGATKGWLPSIGVEGIEFNLDKKTNALTIYGSKGSREVKIPLTAEQENEFQNLYKSYYLAKSPEKGRSNEALEIMRFFVKIAKNSLSGAYQSIINNFPKNE